MSFPFHLTAIKDDFYGLNSFHMHFFKRLAASYQEHVYDLVFVNIWYGFQRGLVNVIKPQIYFYVWHQMSLHGLSSSTEINFIVFTFNTTKYSAFFADLWKYEANWVDFVRLGEKIHYFGTYSNLYFHLVSFKYYCCFLSNHNLLSKQLWHY